jgi:hypothetical protein
VPGPLPLDAWPDGWRQREQTGGEARPEGHATHLIFSLAARTALGSEVRGARRPSGDLGRQAAPCGACLSAAEAAGGRGPCHKNIDKHGRPLLQNPHGRLSTADVVLRAHRLWLRSRPTFWDLFGARSANGRVRLSNAAIHRQSICRPCRICRSSGLAIQASLLFARNFYSPRSARHMPHPLAHHHCSLFSWGVPRPACTAPAGGLWCPCLVRRPWPWLFWGGSGQCSGALFFLSPGISPVCMAVSPPCPPVHRPAVHWSAMHPEWMWMAAWYGVCSGSGRCWRARSPGSDPARRRPHSALLLPPLFPLRRLSLPLSLPPPTTGPRSRGRGGGASRHGHSRQFVF